MAADPGLVVPFQMAAVGAGTALYFALVPPVPFRTLDVALPILVYGIAWAALWSRQERRSLAAGNPAWVAERRATRALKGLALLGAAAVIAGAGIFAGLANSRWPAELNMMAGTPDFGGGTAIMHSHGDGGAVAVSAARPEPLTSVTQLTGPRTGEPDRRFVLTAQDAVLTMASGKKVQAWTYNAEGPGPELRMKHGDLVEVTLANKDIEAGVTIHWHGLDVPNAEDGVAGATQNAVMPGETHTYRFRAEQTGTFWYHTHQESKTGVDKGLFGPLIVDPAEPESNSDAKSDLAAVHSSPPVPEEDITVMTHVWDDVGFAIGNHDGVQQRSIAPGTPVRMRFINTDDWVRQKYSLVGTDFRVTTIDGVALNKPDLLQDTHLEITTGGRMEATFIMPETPVFMSVNNSKKLGILITPLNSNSGSAPASVASTDFSIDAAIPEIPQTKAFDPASYGESAETPFDANSSFDRDFTMILDNKMGFFNGTLDMLYTLNGEVAPNTPMYMVREGDLVKTTIINRGSVDHPMHLHGHHLLVLTKNGKPISGSPWWSDTLDVLPGDTYEVAFRADNPGIWMDHCHNLVHAKAGMTMHLMYEGVVTPYTMGTQSGNHPE
ncbi:multicopper oxidase family protein [Paenibacillus swuensis]|uniref:multicopper oxidase family protein n=1 Tax=Paenibacillus swuensis TaxID=1178515 RepID=UPI001E457990|nr:multicopper oxidase family protein [Paenibacillus swuensis]